MTIIILTMSAIIIDGHPTVDPKTILYKKPSSIEISLPGLSYIQKYNKKLYSSPSLSFPAYQYWTPRKPKQYEEDYSYLSFSLDDYVVCGIDPGTKSMGIRVERLLYGKFHTLLYNNCYTEILDTKNSIYALINIITAIFKSFTINVLNIEHQINPDMFEIEYVVKTLALYNGITVMQAAPTLKKYVFSPHLNDGNFKKESDKLTRLMLEEEGDVETMKTLKNVDESNFLKQRREKISSDLTDPALMIRACHIELVNSCLACKTPTYT